MQMTRTRQAAATFALAAGSAGPHDGWGTRPGVLA